MSKTFLLPWHARGVEEICRELDTTEAGLTTSDAASRLARWGSNLLPQKPPTAWWQFLLRQFQSPLIYVLVAAAVVAMAVGDFKDAFFIFIVLALNALIGGYQEWPVSLTTWLTLFALSHSVFVTMEFHKWTWKWRYGGRENGCKIVPKSESDTIHDA